MEVPLCVGWFLDDLMPLHKIQGLLSVELDDGVINLFAADRKL